MGNKREKVVYIAGPYRADTIRETVENIRLAEKTAIEYWELGYTVICPHMNTALFDGILPDEAWLEGALELLKRSDILALTIFDYPLFDSEETKNEIYFAFQNDIPIYYQGEDITKEMNEILEREARNLARFKEMGLVK
jgi:hypothetical protein